MTIRATEKFHFGLSDRARLWESAEIDPDAEDWGNYIIIPEFGIEADLLANKSLSLQCYLHDNYNSRPAPGRLKNDAKTVIAIDYKF